MKIFITGEEGYIAQKVCLLASEYKSSVVNSLWNKALQEFLTENNYRVSNGKLHNTFYLRTPEVNIENFDSFYRAVQFCEPDVIIHNAAYVGSDVCEIYAEKAIASNVLGTYNVIEVCNRLKIKLIFMGTTVIYGGRIAPFSEDDYYSPSTLYGITKLDAELQVKKLCKEDFIIIRPVFAFGDYPNDTSSAIIRILYTGMKNVLKGRHDIITVRLSPYHMKDYIRCEDVARAILHVMNLGLWGEDFNVASGTSRLFKDYVDYVLNFYFPDYKENFIDYKIELDYLKNHTANIRKILGTGWRPKITFEDGISMTYQSIIRNIDVEPILFASQKRTK